MPKTLQGQHFIRKWREKRKFSLRDLEDRISELYPDGETITHASLNRIENGGQPFNEATLNMISNALSVPRAVLLEVDPDDPDSPDPGGHAMEIMSQMDERTREQAIRMLDLLLKSSKPSAA